MYLALSDFLVALSANAGVWAISVVAAMAVTAVALFIFWDLVGRVVSLTAQVYSSIRRD
jgi:hypothetical protein